MNPFKLLLNLIYPPRCPFCGRVLETWEDGMCPLCQERLPWTQGDQPPVDFCDACLSPLWYKDGVREGVRRYKFRGGQNHAALLGTLMAQCLADRWGDPLDLIVWVPLSAKGLSRRGYDQAELLARRVGELSGLPVVRALEKVRDTRTQSHIQGDSARRANVSGAYRCLPGADLAGKRVVLVDDVATSGATLTECALCLRVAGADRVTALTLCRAGKR